MRIKHGTWIVVADGERYLLLENEGKPNNIALRILSEVEADDNPPTRDQGTDRPGRYPSPNRGRSAVEETDWHRIAKERFARELAHRLNKWALAGRFDNLILAADPRTLGVLRPHFHKELTARLAGEIDKHLTTNSLDEIAAVLSAD